MSDAKKIIIDEDWKSQVQAEKAAASHPAPTQSEPPATAADDPPMPPASMEMLVTTLATEALMALGQIPHPLTNETKLQKNQAQYLIDTLDLLREKTKGNLSDREQQLIEAVLHQVRMVFIAVTTNPPAAEPSKLAT